MTAATNRPASPRVAAIEALSTAVRDATVAGDLDAARIALDALNRLLVEQPGVPAQVLPLRPAVGPKKPPRS